MAHLFEDATPPEIKNAKGLHLITQSTPNGEATQIFLEELHDVYGTEWTQTLVNIMTNEQKKDWFLRLNPNGRIPVILDGRQNPPFPVHETSAQLLYLLKTVDKNDVFGFKEEDERSETQQWLFFWHGSGAPYVGNLGYFRRQKEENPAAVKRFRDETYRIFGVLEIQLSGKYTGQPKEFLAGKGSGKYTVADIKTWPWVRKWSYAGYTEEEMSEFPHLLKWIDRVAERPAVKRGTGEKYQQN